MAVRQPTFVSEQALTADEFLVWLRTVPAGDVHHYELIGGKIVMTPPAGWPHGNVAGEFLRRLGDHVIRTAAGKFFDSSTGFLLPTGEVLEPDGSFIAQARWEAGPRPARGEMIAIVPDLVVEVLSSNRKRDLVEKKASSEAAGVAEYWILDSETQQILVYRGNPAGFGEPERHGRGEAARSLVLAGFEVPVAALFDVAS